jgi:hypothetical protein
VNRRKLAENHAVTLSAIDAIKEWQRRDDEGRPSAGNIQRVITSLELLPRRERRKYRDLLKVAREAKKALVYDGTAPAETHVMGPGRP